MAGPGRDIASMGQVAVQPILTRLAFGNPLWYMPLETILSRDRGDHHLVEPEKGDFFDPKAPKNAFTQFEGYKKAYLTWGKLNGYDVPDRENK